MENKKGYKALLATVGIFFKKVVSLVSSRSNSSSEDFGVEAIISSKEFNKIAQVMSKRFQDLEVAIANGTVKETLKGTALREIKQSLNPASRKFLRANALTRATSISDTIKSRMLNIATDVAKRDGDLLMLRQELLKNFSGELSVGKLQTIATTEYRTAYNYGQNHALEALEDKVSEDGEKVVRVWETAGGPDVRDSHMDLEGEEREVGEKFSNGLEYPCDPNGPPEEVINCRCSISPRVVKQ